MPVTVDFQQRLSDHVEMPAKMTYVDSALIIDEEFKPLYFGAHLDSKEFKGEVYCGPFSTTEEKIEFEIPSGTRHESAIKNITGCSQKNTVKTPYTTNFLKDIGR